MPTTATRSRRVRGGRATSPAGRRRWATESRSCHLAWTTSSAVTPTIWMMTSDAATVRFSITAVWRQISTSRVGWPGAPSSSTSANEVTLNRNTIEAADSTAGRSNGQVTSRKARHGLAPRARAASSTRGSMCDHRPPTRRETTATLKKTPAMTTASAESSSRTRASGNQGLPARAWLMALCGPRTARKAAATTTVGSTNGIVNSARRRTRPGKVKRAKTHAAGRPMSSEHAVMAVARPSVNRMVSRSHGRPHASTMAPVSSQPRGARPVARIEMTGQTKNSARNAMGGIESAIATRRLIAGPSGSIPRSSGHGWWR